jgi:hypothetical protein
MISLIFLFSPFFPFFIFSPSTATFFILHLQCSILNLILILILNFYFSLVSSASLHIPFPSIWCFSSLSFAPTAASFPHLHSSDHSSIGLYPPHFPSFKPSGAFVHEASSVVTPLASFSQFFPLSAWEFYPK